MNNELQNQNTTDTVVLTRGAKRLIKKAVESCQSENNSSNRYDICYKIVEIAFEAYKNDQLDYQLERMGLDTTKKILDRIDVYFFKYHK